MFKSMRLKNFKAYKDSGEIPLAPLTIIVGTNNSGKSTLFHALLALAQTARDSDPGTSTPRLVTKGPLVDLNGYHDIIHGKSHAKSSTFEISIGHDLNITHGITRLSDTLASTSGQPQSEMKQIRFRVPGNADISFSLNEELNEIGVHRSAIRDDENAYICVQRGRGCWSLITPPAEVPKNADVDFRSVFPFVRPRQNGRSSPELLEAFVVSSSCANFWKDLIAKKISHIGPLRLRVPWYSATGSRTNSGFGLGGENLVADLASKEKDRYSAKTRLELVNDWLTAAGILKEIHPEVDKDASIQILVGDEWKGPAKINIAAMGEGVSQILPILAYSLFGMNDDCLLVEQPEIHLHPALQSELGELFIAIAQTGHRQILVETHSEHLVLRVRRRVAEGKLKLQDVAILFVEKHGSDSTVRKLDMTERGHFSDWPKGFFDEAYQESMALAKAANRKGR
jgi:energy-coupling factor transporter ATP-binding protein EcfA2